MRPLLVTPAEVAQAMGLWDEDIRLTSAPFWGDEWAPAESVRVSLACNPWGTPIDPALVRRTEPITVDFAESVARLFNSPVQEAITASWRSVKDGTLALPIEYKALSAARGPDDRGLVAEYVHRLAVVDPPGAQGFAGMLAGLGLDVEKPAGGGA